MGFLKNLKDRFVSAGRNVGKTLGLIPTAKPEPRRRLRTNEVLPRGVKGNQQMLRQLSVNLGALGVMASIIRENRKQEDAVQRAKRIEHGDSRIAFTRGPAEHTRAVRHAKAGI